MTLRSGAWLLAAALGFVFAGFVTGARADDKATATGTWKWEFKRQNGDTVETTLKLKQDGDKLTGTISGRNNSETAIEDGSVKGDDVKFKVTREFNGNKFTQTYNAKLSGDTLKGKVEGERNGQAFSRDWEAKRS